MFPKLSAATKGLPFYLETANDLHDYEVLGKMIATNRPLFKMKDTNGRGAARIDGV